MNINTQQHFSQNPINLDIKRSRFDRSNQLKTTFNTGEIIPIYVDEYLPGDTFQMKTSCLIRMSTPIHPVMDNAYCDIYYFAVPNRLIWDHWKEFNGENTTSAWEQTTEYEIPQITSPVGGWQVGTIADYMGIPTNVENISINALPFRAYTLIINEWFRDQNLQNPAYLNKDETTIIGVNTGTYQTDIQKGGKPFIASKYHDYFTSALPEPQKGPSVLLPLGEKAPVIGNGKAIGLTNGVAFGGLSKLQNYELLPIMNKYNKNVSTTPPTTSDPYINGVIGLTGYPNDSGIIADLTEATASTINQLRQAFAIQRLYERDARGGTRYTEIIKSHFGVSSPDGRQQRPEYLGGKRIPININQVLQTSSTDATSPQGNTAAFSLTADSSDNFTKSFTEHGYIIGLAVVRIEHTYQQGINKMFSRKKRFDFYWPALANIGEQAILNKEIFAQGNATDEQAFGYQEAFAEYRHKPSQVTGQFRSTYNQTLDSWHYGDKYVSLPILGATWIQETKENVDRTLSVTSSQANQFIADFAFQNICVRPIPVYSIPGMIDHN